MNSDFWHRKWQANEIGFHQSDVNALLKAHLSALSLAEGARVFVPLCGKTHDIGWLLSRGFRVAGAELSELAIRQLFEGLGMAPEVSEAGTLTRFAGTGIDIFVGDIFELTRAELGTVDAVFDRAALVALPDAMRERYADHLAAITEAAPQLLLTFEYDQSAMNGPPFSIDADAVRALYADRFAISERARVPVEGGLKGRCPAMEIAWLLSRA